MLYLIYISGAIWLIPILHMAGPAWRVIKGAGDRCDMMALPLCFISLNQIGYCLRWALFRGQIPDMGVSEIGMWSSLYTLSIISALLSTVVWRMVRRAV